MPRRTLEDAVGWSCVANTAPVCMLATQEARRLWMRTLDTEWCVYGTVIAVCMYWYIGTLVP